jgi:hypothetical protein
VDLVNKLLKAQSFNQMVIEIKAYNVTGDGTSFADHNFTLVLKSKDSSVEHSVVRSYLDICDLELFLTATFPDFIIAPCPLIGGQLIIKKLKANKNDPFVSSIRRLSMITSDNNNNNTETIEYDSYFSEDRTSYIISKYEIDENINNLIPLLTQWFNNFFRETRYITIIESNIFAKFFNDEDECYRKLSSDKYNEITEYDFLLPIKLMKSKQVITKFNIPFEVHAGQLLAWRFYSINYDINFSIYLNNEILLENKRYLNGKNEEVINKIQIPAAIANMGGIMCVLI